MDRQLPCTEPNTHQIGRNLMRKFCLSSARATLVWLLAASSICLSAGAQTVAEGPDHATQILGNAWDMSTQNDVYPLLWAHNLSSATVANGIMTGTARDTDPHFWLQFPRIPSSMPAVNLMKTDIDASRFTRLSFMMWLPDTVIPGSRVGRLVWHQGGSSVVEFDTAYSESPLFAVYPGWHLYDFNLVALQPRSGAPWSGPMQGLRIDPCLGCSTVFKIDWARLYHQDDTASSLSLPAGKTHLLTQIRPTDSLQPITMALEGSTGKVSAASLPPGQYPIAPITDGDYALSQRGKAWTFDTPSDVLWAANSGISNAQTSSAGLSGTTSTADPFVLLDIPERQPIDASQYRYLAIDLTLHQVPAQEPGLLVWWGDRVATVQHPSDFIPLQTGRTTYRIDLGQSPRWTGLVKALRIDPLNGPNASSAVGFTLHGIRLTRANGFEETVTFNSTPLTINARPSLAIVSPSLEDGSDYALTEQGKAWNMQPGQVRQPQLSNLLNWSFPSSIPDLNITGSFFQGTSQPAAANHTEGDPHVFLAFQENTNPIDANAYRWLGFDLYVPMDATQQSELTHGAIARLAWKADDIDPGLTTDDIVLMPGMQRYWFDMGRLAYEPTSTRTWSGQVRYLRIDPFEFPESRSFHIGPAQLRTTPTARHVLPVIVQIADSDNDALNVKVKSGSTLLGSASGLSAGGHQIFASLATLPAGEHTITVEVSDGRSSLQRTAHVPVIKPDAMAPLPAHQIKAAERIFNWAESTLGTAIGPGTPSSYNHGCLQSVPSAYGRSYASSGICLFTVDGLVLYTINGNGLTLAGSTTQLLEMAAAAGY